MTTIIFIDQSGEEHSVDASNGDTAMEAAVNAGIEGIEAECGGGCACGTCHTYVDESQLALVGEANPMEQSMLDLSGNAQSNSRLSCQLVVSEELEGLRLTVAPAH